MCSALRAMGCGHEVAAAYPGAQRFTGGGRDQQQEVVSFCFICSRAQLRNSELERMARPLALAPACLHTCAGARAGT